ncbi:FecCD family ABC transporter permease [Corynebacterium nasicanis]|uniref:FecCD family ABC transporter permease n=1 Tax=Corynebacterium nasicanis TaxID=1448267 RepID=A0ABW1QAW6_9CORY
MTPSTGRPHRAVPAAIALAALLLVLVVLSLTVGARPIAVPDVAQALLARDPANSAHAIIWDRRLPRTLAAILAGIAMALAGTLLQTLTRNPLADTGVLGINAGAGFALALTLSLAGWSSPGAFLGAALGGAALATVLVTRLGRAAGGGIDPLQLVLAGVALSAILEGIGDGLSMVDPQTFGRVRAWMTGNVDVASFTPLILLGVGLAVAGVGLLFTHGTLNLLLLGDDTAQALGVNLRRTRIIVLGTVAVLAACATAVVGVITFLGLMVPHLLRQVGLHGHVALLSLGALLGPVLLLGADILGRVLLPGELPAGVVVAFLGAPFLIAVAQRRTVVSA